MLHKVLRIGWFFPAVGIGVLALVVFFASLDDEDKAVGGKIRVDTTKAIIIPRAATRRMREWNVEKFVLLLTVPLPVEERTVPDPTTLDYIVWNESRIVIDAKTGEVLEEFFNPDRLNDEVQLKTTLETLVVGPPDPGVPAWPRDDVPPSLPKSRPGGPDDPLIYQPPDHGSGMFVSAQHGTPNPGERLIARTCNSSLVFDGTTGKVVVDKVTPAEREMFDRFLSEIEYEEEGGGQDEAQS